MNVLEIPFNKFLGIEYYYSYCTLWSRSDVNCDRNLVNEE